MGNAGAQSSKDGSFTGRTYTNAYFHLSFDLPALLEPEALNSTTLHAAPSADAWMMAVARQGKQPYGMILISQHIQPNGIRSAEDFLRRVRNTRDPGDIAGASGHKANAGGLVFDWFDWKTASGERDSAVLTQRGDYLIVARCNTRNDGELEAMKNALFGMHLINK